jgi:uncharacterized RDD family membrane protein YckC
VANSLFVVDLNKNPENQVDSGSAACAECGMIFPREEMIRHRSAYVCANCKPIFMQKLAEGAAIRTSALRYAGFWVRFAAIFLDGIILLVGNTILQVVIGSAAGLSTDQAIGIEPQANIILGVILLAIQFGTGICYEVVLVGKYGATLGKMACNVRVVTGEGSAVSYARALGRYFAKFLNAFTLGIGYIIAAFDAEKRTLHDRICNTRVVMT